MPVTVPMPVTVHCLHGIARDIERSLDQLLGVGAYFGQTGIVVAPQRYAGRFGQDQAANPFQGFMDIHRTKTGHTMRRQQALHQRLQAVGFLDDDLRVFAQGFARQLVLQQLRRAADAAERVLDFMREVAQQFTVGLLLQARLFQPGNPQMRIDRAHFDQHGITRLVQRRYAAAETNRWMTAYRHVEFVFDDGFPLGTRRLDGGEQLGAAFEHRLDISPDQQDAGYTQQGLGSRINVGNATAGIQNHGAGGEVIQS